MRRSEQGAVCCARPAEQAAQCAYAQRAAVSIRCEKPTVDRPMLSSAEQVSAEESSLRAQPPYAQRTPLRSGLIKARFAVLGAVVSLLTKIALI